MSFFQRIIRFFYVIFFLLSFSTIALSLLAIIQISNVERALLIIFGVSNALIFSELAFGKWKK